MLGLLVCTWSAWSYSALAGDPDVATSVPTPVGERSSGWSGSPTTFSEDAVKAGQDKSGTSHESIQGGDEPILSDEPIRAGITAAPAEPSAPLVAEHTVVYCFGALSQVIDHFNLVEPDYPLEIASLEDCQIPDYETDDGDLG